MFKTGTPIITVEHLIGGTISATEAPQVSNADKQRLSSYILKIGDIVFSRVGSIDRNGLVTTNEDGWLFSGRLLRIRFLKSGISPQFISNQFSTKKFIDSVKEVAVGQTMPSLNTKIIAHLLIYLPPLPEQKAIAKVLSDTDSLIESLDALIDKKKAIKQGAMQELLTGKRRLPGFAKSNGYKQTDVGVIPEDWEIVIFGKISHMNGRIGWQGLKQNEFTSNRDDPFLITGMDFRGNSIDWENIYHISQKRYDEAVPIQLRPNDVLMTKDGTIGKTLFVDHIPYPHMASLNSHLLVFRPIDSSYEPIFLFFILNSKYFFDHIEKEKSGTTFFGLSQTATSKFLLPLPPLPEQKAIAKVLADMDSEIEALERKRDKYKQIKKGMMEQLLTGKVRLV
jgi:type I restriction enzyme S subunit